VEARSARLRAVSSSLRRGRPPEPYRTLRTSTNRRTYEPTNSTNSTNS